MKTFQKLHIHQVGTSRLSSTHQHWPVIWFKESIPRPCKTISQEYLSQETTRQQLDPGVAVLREVVPQEVVFQQLIHTARLAQSIGTSGLYYRGMRGDLSLLWTCSRPTTMVEQKTKAPAY